MALALLAFRSYRTEAQTHTVSFYQCGKQRYQLRGREWEQEFLWDGDGSEITWMGWGWRKSIGTGCTGAGKIHEMGLGLGQVILTSVDSNRKLGPGKLRAESSARNQRCTVVEAMIFIL